MTQPCLKFDGSDYSHERDSKRLSDQLSKIISVMKDGMWRTLNEISKLAGAPEASVSAQLRHLRKPRFGSNTVNKKHLGRGLYEYQLILKQ